MLFSLRYHTLGVFRMHVKKHLSFTGLRKQLSERLSQLEDFRQQGKVEYSLHDCVMSGFALMYFQDPSLLEFQRRMEEHGNRNNLRNMFCVEAIPGDTQLRDVLDELPDILIIGTGSAGVMRVPEDVQNEIRNKGIELIIEPTESACNTFNKISKTKHVVAALHLTC